MNEGPPVLIQDESVPIVETICLNKSDLEYLASKGIGLRHVSTSTQANLELKEGVTSGDAIAISAFTRLEPMFDGLSGIKIRTLLGQMTQEDISRISAALTEAITKFIKESFAWDLNQLANQDDASISVADIEEIMRNHTRFLLGKFAPTNLSYDVVDFYGLGKFGKRTVEASNLWPTIVSAADEKTIDLILKLSGDGIKDSFTFDLVVSTLGTMVAERVITQLQAMAKVQF